MKLKERISWLMGTLQQSLFPHLDECLPAPLTEQEERLVEILELVKIEKYVPNSADRQLLGRPIKEREAIARSFLAKAVLRYQHTSSLRHALRSTPNIRAICGFARRRDVPSESTFSRAFAEFAKAGLGTVVHDALVKEHLSTELIGHVSRDSTAIVGREKPAKKARKAKAPRKKGRPAKGEERQPAEPKRLDVQRTQSAKEAIGLLPTVCDRGVKKNAKGDTDPLWRRTKQRAITNGLPQSAAIAASRKISADAMSWSAVQTR